MEREEMSQSRTHATQSLSIRFGEKKKGEYKKIKTQNNEGTYHVCWARPWAVYNRIGCPLVNYVCNLS